MLQMLVVDDEQHWVDSIADSMDWSLIRIGTVHKACSGQEALAVLAEHVIDILITDVRMPEMDGLELVRQVHLDWPQVKTVILTGHADFEYARQAIQHQVHNYLLKPVQDRDLLDTVRLLAEQIHDEWEQVASYRKAVSTLRQNMSLIRSDLLNELLQLERYPHERLYEKMQLLELPFREGEACALLALRVESGESGGQARDPLIEFALGNIAEEIFNRGFDVWSCKDRYGYLVFLVKLREEASPKERDARFERAAFRLQHNVKVFLKLDVSILFSGWFAFPERLSCRYSDLTSAFMQKVGDDRAFFMEVREEPASMNAGSLMRMYEPPALVHLMESARWEDVDRKREAIFEELTERCFESREHLLEVYFYLCSAFTFFAHKNRIKLADLLGRDFEGFTESSQLQSIRQLDYWSRRVIGAFRSEIDNGMRLSRSGTVALVQKYVEENLSKDVSLQSIADSLHFHPTHISKIFKLEAGESLSQYIYRIRMEKAACILRDPKVRIYEAGTLVGLPNAAYFIKCFKKYYGVTPQEYREK